MACYTKYKHIFDAIVVARLHYLLIIRREICLEDSKKYMLLGKMANILALHWPSHALITNLIPSGTVSAQHQSITATVSCQSDGTKLVTWTIANSEGSNHPMDITAINPTITGVGVGTIVESSVQGTQTFAGNDHSTVSLSVSGHWAYDGATNTSSGSKNLGSNN